MQKQYSQEPIFIGGFPGSGTRVVSRILSMANIFMGSKINNTNDSVYFAPFLNKWVGKFISEEFSDKNELYAQMKKDFDHLLEGHLSGIPDDVPWGSKNPRNILILPFLHSLFPEMKFIHVLRDGRDLAASPKQRVKIKQYAIDLLGNEVSSVSELVNLWSAITLKGFNDGEQFLGKNYLLIKFEDMCTNPSQVITEILKFSGGSMECLDAAIDEVNPPVNAIGRWKAAKDQFEHLSTDTRKTLEKFGYSMV